MNPLLCALEVCSLFPYTPSANQRYLHAVNEIKNIYFWCFCMLTDTQVGFDKCKKKTSPCFYSSHQGCSHDFLSLATTDGGKAWQNVKGGRGGRRGPSKTEHFGVQQPPAMCLVHSHNALGLFLNVFIG